LTDEDVFEGQLEGDALARLSDSRDTAPPPSPPSFNRFSEITSFICAVADLLRADDRQATTARSSCG
jgi:hypothetical protein